MKNLGLSFDESSLRASLVTGRFGVLKPLKTEEARLPAAPEEKAGFIKDTLLPVFRAGGLEVRNATISISFSFFSHHIVELPLTKASEIKQALPFELEKYLPLPPEEYVYDFLTIQSTGGRSRNLVFSIRKEKLHEIYGFVKDAGLNITGIKCSFIEVLNEFLQAKKNFTGIFIYEAETSYHIAGLKNSLPEILRVIPKGLREKEMVPFMEGISESFKGDIYLAGALDHSIADKIKTNSIPHLPSYAVAASGMRGGVFAGKNRLELNFCPPDLFPPGKDYYPVTISGLAAFAILIFFLTSVYSYYKDYSALSRLRGRIQIVKKQASGLMETKRRLDAVQAKRKFLYEFQVKKSLDIKILRELSTILPKDTWLINFSIDDKGKVEMEGFTKRAADIIPPLEKTGLFRDVGFAAPVVSKEGNERFSIRMEVRAAGGRI